MEVKFEKQAKEIAEQFSEFTPDELLDWIVYVNTEMNKIPRLKKSNRDYENHLINESDVFDFIENTDNKDISVILKSKHLNRQVEITDKEKIRKIILSLKQDLNPDVKKHKKGKIVESLRRKIMRDLHLFYTGKYKNKKGVQLFIKAIFEAALFPVSIEAIKKDLDHKNWRNKKIFRDIEGDDFRVYRIY